MYIEDHIWNSNEMRIQARHQLVARVLVKKGSHQVYNTISKSMEWLTMICVVNGTKGSLPRFYIFMGERIKDEYIKHCKAKTCMGMQREAWMIIFYSKNFYQYSRAKF
jgi:hypothetical protein